MWNYYVKGGSYQGYNIGFSANSITSSIHNVNVDKVMFGPVVYDNKQKVSLLKNSDWQSRSKIVQKTSNQLKFEHFEKRSRFF